jgi:hypothetical protein
MILPVIEQKRIVAMRRVHFSVGNIPVGIQ